jgi:hypothetical protein
MQDAAPDRDLGLVGRKRVSDRRQRGLRAVRVDEREPIGVLGVRGPQQPRERGVREVRRVGPVHAQRRARHDHQPRRGQGIGRQPRLKQAERAVGDLVDGGQQAITGAARPGRRQHEVGNRGALGHGPLECCKVGVGRPQRGELVTEHRDLLLPHVGVHRGPAHVVQRLARGRTRGQQRARVDRAGGDRIDREHGRPGVVYGR